MSKADADGLFWRALQESNVPFLYRWLMWAAVRWSSLSSSGFRDGIADLPQLLLISVFPGLPALAGGLIVLMMLLVFRAVELALWIVLWPLHQLNEIDVVARLLEPDRIKDPTRLSPTTGPGGAAARGRPGAYSRRSIEARSLRHCRAAQQVRPSPPVTRSL